MEYLLVVVKLTRIRMARRRKNGNAQPPRKRQLPPRASSEKEAHPNLTSRPAIRRIANPRTRRYHSRRCKRGIPTTVDSLPDELLFDILSRVPAEDIHEDARFVCRRWKRIIKGDAFAQAHLHRSGYGLLILTGDYEPPIIVVPTQGGGIEVTKVSTESESIAQSSCDGLILVADKFKGYTLHVVNPATKYCFEIPKFSCERPLVYFGMAYAAASMKYKVVATHHFDENPRLQHCKVLTVGVDSTWRHVATHQLSLEVNGLLSFVLPLITEGFMHWTSPYGNDVVTLDVEKEVFAETPAPLAPLDRQIPYRKYYYLSTGRHLSLLITGEWFTWEVWEMEGGSGEWRKVLPGIDLNGHESEIYERAYGDDVLLVPVGWVKYPEALLFFSEYDHCHYFDETNSRYIIYNLDRDEIKSIKISESSQCCEALVHKNSLVCLS